MSELIIYNGKVYTEDDKIDNGYIHVKDGQIIAIGEVDDKAAIDNDTTNKIQVIDAKGHHVLPGFIDIHIHGGLWTGCNGWVIRWLKISIRKFVV